MRCTTNPKPHRITISYGFECSKRCFGLNKEEKFHAFCLCIEIKSINARRRIIELYNSCGNHNNEIECSYMLDECNLLLRISKSPIQSLDVLLVCFCYWHMFPNVI